jgi:hypothetical protein
MRTRLQDFRLGAAAVGAGALRRRSNSSFDSYFGDEEELEDVEGLGLPSAGLSGIRARREEQQGEEANVIGSGENRGATIAAAVHASDSADTERRLSRELEAGFRDDSESESEGDRRLSRSSRRWR